MRVVLAFLLLSVSCATIATASAEESPPSDAAVAERKKLAGTWEGYAVEDRGERPDRGPVHLRLIIEGDKISAVDLGSPDKKDMGSGAFKLDPGKEIKQIDATGIILPGR